MSTAIGYQLHLTSKAAVRPRELDAGYIGSPGEWDEHIPVATQENIPHIYKSCGWPREVCAVCSTYHDDLVASGLEHCSVHNEPALPKGDCDCAHVRDSNLGLPLAQEIAHRPDPKQPLKYDSAEAPTYRGALWYFPMAINEVARVSAFGATKYSWNKGWLAGHDAFPRYSDALLRHMGKEAYETHDTGPKDSQLRHAAHVAWNALARLEVLLYAEKVQSTKDHKHEVQLSSPTSDADPFDGHWVSDNPNVLHPPV